MEPQVRYVNPATVHAPAGAYTHAVLIPPSSRLLLVSGQVGVRLDGTCRPTLAEQTEQVFANLGAILAANDMGFEDVVKLTTYVLVGQAAETFAQIRYTHLGDHRPASTLIYVPQLFRPDWLLEMEAVAARPERANATQHC